MFVKSCACPVSSLSSVRLYLDKGTTELIKHQASQNRHTSNLTQRLNDLAGSVAELVHPVCAKSHDIVTSLSGCPGCPPPLWWLVEQFRKLRILGCSSNRERSFSNNKAELSAQSLLVEQTKMFHQKAVRPKKFQFEMFQPQPWAKPCPEGGLWKTFI